jgi:hypothetical protein
MHRSSVEFVAGTLVQNFSLVTSMALSNFPESHHAKERSTSQEAPSLLPEVHTSAIVDSVHQHFNYFSDSSYQGTAIVYVEVGRSELTISEGFPLKATSFPMTCSERQLPKESPAQTYTFLFYSENANITSRFEECRKRGCRL